MLPHELSLVKLHTLLLVSRRDVFELFVVRVNDDITQTFVVIVLLNSRIHVQFSHGHFLALQAFL